MLGKELSLERLLYEFSCYKNDLSNKNIRMILIEKDCCVNAKTVRKLHEKRCNKGSAVE